MSVVTMLKSALKSIPEPMAGPLSHVPFSLRLGFTYKRSASIIRAAEVADSSVLDADRLIQLRSILFAAVKEVDFYRDFYHSNGFKPDDLRTLADWDRVPIVTRSDLQGVPLVARSSRDVSGLPGNTGGTSGRPLEFLLDKKAVAREWAHMHFIWRARGYRPEQLKLRFTGKRFDSAQVLHYHPMHNEYIVNADSPMSAVVEAIAALPCDTVPRWVHGYPSLVAEFAHTLAEQAPSLAALFRSRLFGVLLGSEFPASVYRTVIEEVLSSNVVSWYGHSEMALLARETALGVYESLPTYGYAEAVALKDGSACRLVCTSLHNRAHPFIRYDTGDLVEPISRQRGSLAFRIREGRVGDFVIDRLGLKVSLTAIIFGRHHAAFERLKHLQVRQDSHGQITLLVVPLSSSSDLSELREGFDFSGLNLDWELEIVGAPIRTPAGKIRLKVVMDAG
ncbi:MAG: phenylacetate--CoA ligase family protein [Glaciimonas sp.]|nr:phenylacetate--CoA ligase family protein [Glaciimonas sp.]